MIQRIKLLPEVVANQIAAGEVVNRPSSVVKELMENALDAGAHCVKVNQRDGGKELIQVVDDGCGMSPADARLAFDRHATSKINSVDDIYALHTFGFRGEALASIAAVAQVELRTRTEEEATGTATEIYGGKFLRQEPVACPRGAQFFVRNLFYNVPARRQFLERGTTSAAQIRAEFQRVALCYPGVEFELYENDKPHWLLKSSSLAERIVALVGNSIKNNLLEVGADTSIAKLYGYIGRPAAAKKRNAEQFMFVNGRYFKSTYLNSAIMRAYDKLIAEGSAPSYFLFLEIDPSRIDVNVHPQKTEVRFADQEAIWQIIHAAARETLAKTGAVPMIDFDRSAVEIPVLQKGIIYDEPRANTREDYNPFREGYVTATEGDANVDFTGFDVPYNDPDEVPSRFADISPAISRLGRRSTERGSVSPLSALQTSAVAPGAECFDEFRSGGFGASQAPDTPSEDFEIPSSALQESLTTPSEEHYPATLPTTEIASGSDEEFEEFASSSLHFREATEQVQELAVSTPAAHYTAIQPLAGGMLVAVESGALVVVDVRRARERILYDRYITLLGQGHAATQQLLFPEEIILSHDEAALMEEHAVDFAALGFDLTVGDAGHVEVRGLPADLRTEQMEQTIYELLQTLALPVDLQAERRERLAATMARNGARGNLPTLTHEEAEALLAELAAGSNPHLTPSGKAIQNRLGAEALRALIG